MSMVVEDHKALTNERQEVLQVKVKGEEVEQTLRSVLLPEVQERQLKSIW